MSQPVDRSDADPPPRPLPNTYWVVPNRILAGEYPGGEDETHARERIALFARAGIDAFFDLTEEGELPPYRHLLPARSEYLRSGIADTWVPTNPSQTQALIAAMRAALQRRRRIYVHCRAGIGRTGLVIGCYLADQAADGRSALKRLNELWRQSDRARDWPRIPQTAEQADYIQRWPQLAKSAPRAEPGSHAAGPAADAAASRATPARGRPAARTSSAPASRSSAAGPMTSAPQDGSLFRSIGRANTTARTQGAMTRETGAATREPGTDGHGAPDHQGPRPTKRR